jgi:hypothetical protein
MMKTLSFMTFQGNSGCSSGTLLDGVEYFFGGRGKKPHKGDSLT